MSIHDHILDAISTNGAWPETIFQKVTLAAKVDQSEIMACMWEMQEDGIISYDVDGIIRRIL